MQGYRIITSVAVSPRRLPVEPYVPPKEFDQGRDEALQMGFQEVASGPLVRSSYQTWELYQATQD